MIDLGAAPGGWSQIISEITDKIIAVDLLCIDPIKNVEFICGDFLEKSTIDKIDQLLNGRLADVIMSDMAPSTCGIQKVDHIMIMNIIEVVFDFCKIYLANNGALVTKVFQGGAETKFLNELKRVFKKVSHFKPKSSRKESSEMYLVCCGFLRDKL